MKKTSTLNMNLQIRDIVKELDDGVVEQVAIIKNLHLLIASSDLTIDTRNALETLLLKISKAEKMVRELLGNQG